jgi:hypothetical protein
MDNLGSDYNADKSWPTAIVISNECYGCCGHHHNHSVAFWNEVDKVPDYRERKVWLRNYGASLDL